MNLSRKSTRISKDNNIYKDTKRLEIKSLFHSSLSFSNIFIRRGNMKGIYRLNEKGGGGSIFFKKKKKEATNKRTDEQTNVLCPDAIYIYIFIHTYLYISCLVVSHTHTTDVLLQKYKKKQTHKFFIKY